MTYKVTKYFVTSCIYLFIYFNFNKLGDEICFFFFFSNFNRLGDEVLRHQFLLIVRYWWRKFSLPIYFYLLMFFTITCQYINPFISNHFRKQIIHTIPTTSIKKSSIQSKNEIKNRYTFKTNKPSCSQSNYNHLYINDVFYTLQKVIWVKVMPQKLSFFHQSHICTSIKKNISVPYLLEKVTTCTTNHKIAQSSTKFDKLILLSWIQFKNKVWYK